MRTLCCLAALALLTGCPGPAKTGAQTGAAKTSPATKPVKKKHKSVVARGATIVRVGSGVGRWDGKSKQLTLLLYSGNLSAEQRAQVAQGREQGVAGRFATIQLTWAEAAEVGDASKARFWLMVYEPGKAQGESYPAGRQIAKLEGKVAVGETIAFASKGQDDELRWDLKLEGIPVVAAP